MAVDPTQGFDRHAEIVGKLSVVGAVLHTPRSGSVAQSVGCHVQIEPGICDGAAERLDDPGDRIAIPFDDVLVAEALALPAADMSKQSIGEPNRPPTLLWFPPAVHRPIRLPRIPVDSTP